MKKWNAPEMVELNINETASGIFGSCVECWPFLDKEDKKEEDKTPTTPEDYNS